MSSTSTTLLRVKRRRTAPPLAPKLRLPVVTEENVDHAKKEKTSTQNEDELLSNLMHSSTYISKRVDHWRNNRVTTGDDNDKNHEDENDEVMPQVPLHKRKKSGVVLFSKIVESYEEADKDTSAASSSSADDFSLLPVLKKRKVANGATTIRVVDCVHDDHDDDYDYHLGEDGENRSKRRKIALKMMDCREINLSGEDGDGDLKRKKMVGTTNNKQRVEGRGRGKGIPIIDPFTRMMDDCLMQYHTSGPGLVSILDTLLHNFYMQTTDSNKQTINHVCSNGMGTILHGAALWNDLKTVNTALQLGIDVHLLDADGRNALNVATLAGNTTVIECLRPYYDSLADAADQHQSPKEKEVEFVYDIYCLTEQQMHEKEKEAIHSPASVTDHDSLFSLPSDRPQKGSSDEEASLSSTTTENGNPSDDDDLSVEIQGCKQYWNEEGELILELDTSITDTAAATVGLGDDYDSNDEQFEGNDYPDEDEYDRDWYESDSEPIEEYHGNINRHHVDYCSDDYDQHEDDDDALEFRPTRMTSNIPLDEYYHEE